MWDFFAIFARCNIVFALRTRLFSIFLFIGSLAVLAMGGVDTAGIWAGSLYDGSFADSILAGQVASDTALVDAIPTDTVLADTVRVDSVQTDTVTKKKSSTALDEPVVYAAKDSITFDMKANRATLFGGSQVNYLNLELLSDKITMSLDSSLVHASGQPDSTGEMQGKPTFKQGEEAYEPDSMSYNFKTRKAFITNVYTKQGEGFMIANEAKRDSSGVMYGNGGKYTTCDAKHPHFYLKMTRYKVKPGQSVVFGPAYLVVADVPLPLAVPYGFFPFQHSYQSGFVMPTYGEETSRGFYLRDGGYYFAINDYMDLKVLGEVYTKGSWGINATYNYNWRYKFAGSLFFSYQKYIDEGQPSMADMKITWTHRMDSKANPNQSFSASVNFATQSYERNNINSRYNPETYTQSTRTSSVSYSRTFPNIGLTLSATANMSQNMRDSTISLTLPTLNITLARMYPFKRKVAVGKERWYEKIAFSYTGTIQNSITTKNDKVFHSNFLKDWRNGMRHQIPISASFQLFKYINLTTSFNFTDRMYFQRIDQTWDQDKQEVVRDTTLGFYNVYNFNTSLSLNTKLYGFYKPLPMFGGKKIQAIRHVVTPSVSFSYAPDFGSETFGFYGSYQRTDREGNPVGKPVTYSRFSNGIYGTPGRGMTGSVTMDLSNNLEMKVYSKRDSTGFKKISLIDELGGSLSYNFAAQTRPWSDLSTRLRLKLSKRYTFSMNAVFATYAYEFDENGNVRVGDRTEWSYGRFGRFQGMSQNISYTFSNSSWREIRDKVRGLFSKSGYTGSDETDDEDDEDEDTSMGDNNIDPDRKKSLNGAKKDSKAAEVDEDGYLKFSIPWSFTASYGVIMSENTSAPINPKNMRYPYKFTHTLNFSGNVRIADGWNINFSSGYDFNYKRLSMTTASLNRKIHCFSMSCSMVLLPYRSFNFTFQADAATLRDVLRWKKQSEYGSNIEWY